MRYSLLSMTGFVVFVASSSMSIAAGTSCKSHYYQTECQEGAACNWNTKRNQCPANKTYVGCGSHSELYCEPNGCHWDSETSQQHALVCLVRRSTPSGRKVCDKVKKLEPADRIAVAIQTTTAHVWSGFWVPGLSV